MPSSISPWGNMKDLCHYSPNRYVGNYSKTSPWEASLLVRCPDFRGTLTPMDKCPDHQGVLISEVS